MFAGVLNLYEEEGWFFHKALSYSPVSFEEFENKQLEGKPYEDLGAYDFEPKSDTTAVAVDAKTEYITGYYKDDFQLQSKYEVTIWLLVEEQPTQDPNTNYHE